MQLNFARHHYALKKNGTRENHWHKDNHYTRGKTKNRPLQKIKTDPKLSSARRNIADILSEQNTDICSNI